MNCLAILKKFIEDSNLGIDNIDLVSNRIIELNISNPDKADVDFTEDIIASAIVDSFKLNASVLKDYSDFCIKNNIQIGRRHKKVLLRFFNYRINADKELFFKELAKENKDIPSSLLEKKLDDYEIIASSEAFSHFFALWNKAVKENDETKLGDYLFGLYSKIHAYLNNSGISNAELFAYNEPFIKKDLSDLSIKELRDFCSLSSDSFYEEYCRLLKRDLQKDSLDGRLEPVMNQDDIDNEMIHQSRIFDRGGDLHYLLTEGYDAVYLKINQSIYDIFSNFNSFMDYILDAIQQSYRLLVNNKVFSVEIDNIYVGNRNIKWLLYAYIGVYAERFIKTKEYRKFFSPEKICLEMFKVYGYNVLEDITPLLKRFYQKGEEVIDQIYSKIVTDNSFEEFSEFLKQWGYVYYGFSFNDCFVIETNDDLHAQFSAEVKNDNKLLFVFYKYRMDERKIPCPVCNGLNVSGNSYPEVGHRSWECKNVICSSRSKSDRGKRYSFKTNYMQFGAQHLESDNIIAKDLISKWRKDIISVTSDTEIYKMFIKYFSFSGEKILFINANAKVIENLEPASREVVLVSLLDFKSAYRSKKEIQRIKKNSFNEYFESGDYLRRFIREKNTSIGMNPITFTKNAKTSYVINGDSFNVLERMPRKSVSAAVTSPPYFNAREYSQWENMYLYYIDMYNIVKNTLKVLDDGGVFVYNIGDINGNEMTVAKSNMGTKRMLLGAYSILIFEKAGYELVDNYIWNKGEPQSKRSTNDGNFTPHYQKPVNCYEHMFVFKRKNDKININSNLEEKWRKYIVEFKPVYKINCHGENILGHTAPYPEDIPDLAIALCGRKGKYILDPFLGSGTTVIAANRNGYNGIGIEYSKEYAELSKSRIEDECAGVTIELLV